MFSPALSCQTRSISCFRSIAYMATQQELKPSKHEAKKGMGAKVGDKVGDMGPRPSPYLRSCRQECEKPVVAQVKGTIPLWLEGNLLRNGPGLRKIGQDEYKHLFDGLALMHQFHIEKGQVSYRNRFLRSDAYTKNTTANRIVVSEFGTRAYPDPCKSILQRFMAYFSFKEFTDNDSVNFYPIGDQIYATTETTYIRRIDPKTLESKELVNFADYITVNTQTAHPHISEDGTIFNLGSKFGRKGTYNVVKIPGGNSSPADAKVMATIPVRHSMYPSYYHSFAMTENYIVFIEQPLVTSIPLITYQHFTGGAYSDALKWKPKYKTRFHLINRKTGEMVQQKYVGDPFAFFHTINAFEDEDHVVVDLCCYKDGNVIQALYANSFNEGTSRDKDIKSNSDLLNAEARRFVLPLIKGKNETAINENLNKLNYSKATAIMRRNSSVFCLHELLTKSNFVEFPRINYEKYNGKKYRYFFCVSRREHDSLVQVMKVDTNTRENVTWSEENHFPSEPVFVPKPNAVDEDDGVVLSAVLNELDETKGFLVILDGKTLQELARADFQTPAAIPADFHGIFLGNDTNTVKA